MNENQIETPTPAEPITKPANEPATGAPAPQTPAAEASPDPRSPVIPVPVPGTGNGIRDEGLGTRTEDRGETPATTAENDEDAGTEAETVPIERLKGVQRALANATRDRDSAKAEAESLRTQLAAANAAAAGARIAEIRATHKDIVPALIAGDSIDAVNASLEQSRQAYASALAHVTQTAAPTQKPAPAASDTAPVLPATQPSETIAAGLRSLKAGPNIND